MSIELENKKYGPAPSDPEQERHEELIQMLNHSESIAHSEPISALSKLKDALAKFF